jgi:2-polyprenyl-3-methyl-5-hydroxy-6-metoxy-1,4-benzoquinol methylase
MNFYNSKKLRVLDFGVGGGRHTKYLLNLNHSLLATDISKEAINLSKKNIPLFNNYRLFKDGNFSNLLKEKKFDLIICWETIHWVGDFEKIKNILEIFKKILKKNSHLIITFPSEDHYLISKNLVSNFVYKINKKERKNSLICAPNLKTLKNLFSKNGLNLEQVFKYSHGREIYNKVKNEMLSSNIRKNLFSMYAFLLKNTK